MKPSPRSPKRFILECILWIVAAALFGVGCTALASLLFTPKPTDEKRAIYEGVSYEVVEYDEALSGPSRVMILEIDWAAPGVELLIREPTLADNGDPDQHYELILPSVEVVRQNLAALVNLTRYYPDTPSKSYPGAKVGTIETVVIDGTFTHLHEHSYLFWWDQEMKFHLESEKPPKESDLRRAKLGFGVQGIQIFEGQIKSNSLSEWDDLAYRRTFLGTDPERKKLWIFAFENATAAFMSDFALAHGVVYGAQVDSGSATHLIVGRNANGLLPFTGVRGGRPLAAYLGIRANPIE